MAQALDEHEHDRDDDDDDDDRDDFDEDPDESDQDSDDDAAAEAGETLPCPFCKKPVYEGADLCRHCRNYIGGEDTPPRRVPPLVWIGVALAGVCTLTWVVFR